MENHEDKLNNFFQIMLEELNHLKGSENYPVQRLIDRARKRARYNKPNLHDEALKSFVLLNDSLVSSKITLSDSVVNNAKYFLTVIFERYNTSISESNIQVSLDMDHLFDLWNFGPGASNGVKGSHIADKISQAMTYTRSCEHLVVRLRSSNFYFSSFDTKEDRLMRQLEGSRLTTVPKNEETVRIIAIEPSGNMCLQLAAGTYMSNVLKSIGLNIHSQQPKNKALAKRASFDNSLATIDLKSASDMFTPELIRRLFPVEWYELLMKIRSPSTTIQGKEVSLNMISTMGNGFTFPMMTLTLTALLYGFRAERNGPTLYVDWKNSAIFGDDIIIPSYEYEDFCSVLKGAGLIVNSDKSYCNGPFRESCGGDYYNGVDVTPFYVKSLSHDSDIFVVINQVLDWSSRENLFLVKTLYYLKSLLRRPFLVPEWSNPNQGILTAQVEGRYSFLDPVTNEVVLKEQHFVCMLGIGGYIYSRGLHSVYLPRQFKTRYKVKKGRIPKGFLTGWDPSKRSHTKSVRISNWVDLIFNY